MSNVEAAKPALNALAHINKAHRDALARIEAARQTKRPWPAWCYAPISLARSTLLDLDGITEEAYNLLPPKAKAAYYTTTTAVAALAAWRMTKGVYAFDPDLLAALWDTPITGRIPAELLLRLPEWCVYVPLPSPKTPIGNPLGVFVHLDWRSDRTTLRFLLILPKGAKEHEISVWPLDISLESGNVTEGVQSFAMQWVDGHGNRLVGEALEQAQHDAVKLAGPLVSLALYLCTEEPDVTGRGVPGNPRPTKTKRGLREFPAAGIRSWEVGVRVGAALRLAQKAAREREDREWLEGTGDRTVRPHVRRAHWHTYLLGPRSGKQKAVLKWLHWALVNANSPDDLPVVVRPVR